MAIEKMSFVHISGPGEMLDGVLLCALRTGLFQPENAGKLSEYSVGVSPSYMNNPYAGLLEGIIELAGQLQVTDALKKADGTVPDEPVMEEAVFTEAAAGRLGELRGQLLELGALKRKQLERAAACEAAVAALEQSGRGVFQFLGSGGDGTPAVRLGKLPGGELPEIPQSGAGDLFDARMLKKTGDATWCVYLAYGSGVGKIDELFRSRGFERLELPEYAGGKAGGVREYLVRELKQAAGEALESARSLEKEAGLDIKALRTLYGAVRTRHDAFDLRRFTVLFRERFHVVGYLPARDEAAFKACFDSMAAELDIRLTPASEAVPDLKIPVRLKNNRFVRPFEMFVEMYGSPGYNDIDPTPFLAWSYCLLFGIMFGDVGQGICISLLGILLYKWKRMSLGPIMTRIGISSAIFGAVYGSVFGMEHMMDWFYIGVLGLSEKPVEVLRPSTTNQILVAAVGLGAAVILIVMLFNICVGIKRRDEARILLSSNGLPGIVFFVSVLAAALSRLTSGRDLLSTPYVIFLIALPLLIIFFKEPIERLIRLGSRETLLHKSRHLSETVGQGKIDTDIPALFTGKYIHARFGRLPTDSYRKMRFYEEDPFLIHPIKSDRDYIWCIYAMAASDSEQVDAILHDLRFERIFIPNEALESSQAAESFIRGCISAGQYPPPDVSEGGAERASRRHTIFDAAFPAGVANFVVESFFEMFEVLLSFVTNTMSFLRVGGFILSHAGMMSVVMALSEMAGAGARPIVLVFGNLFVMGLEGLIVGIQALRLEFYEMFSRFFDAGGEPFVPVSPAGGVNNNRRS